MKSLIAIPTILFALQAAADCPAQRPTDAPSVPSGTEASKQEMYAAQSAVQDYVDSVQAFLTCRAPALSIIEHDYYVELAHEAALDYNEALQAYRRAQEALASN